MFICMGPPVCHMLRQYPKYVIFKKYVDHDEIPAIYFSNSI